MTLNKVLIISAAWVGDIVMTQALFKLLKAQNPAVMIDVLAPTWAHPLLQHMPEIRRCIPSPLQHGKLQLKERYKIGCNLRTEGYDQVIVIPNSFKSALIPFFARIPLRTGWAREGRQLLLNDCRGLHKKQLPLMVQRLLALGYPAGKFPAQHIFNEHIWMPALSTTASAVASALKNQGLAYPTKQVLGLCPGAAYGPAKRWPTEYFAEVARAQAQAGWEVWIFGSANEQPLAQAIQAASGNVCVDLSSKTSLSEAINLMSLTTAMITNDSGLMHIAAALNKPLIALYGSSSPDFTPPLTSKAKILSLNLECSPCFERECPLKHFKCMNELLPSKVLQELALLSVNN